MVQKEFIKQKINACVLFKKHYIIKAGIHCKINTKQYD